MGDCANNGVATSSPDGPDYGSMDPEAAQLLRQLNSVPADLSRPVEDFRREYSARALALQAQFPKDPVKHMQDVVADPSGRKVPVRVYVPETDTEQLPVCIWYHGGGFVLGSLDIDDGTCRRLAAAAGCVVVSVDYRLAPEHPFPAAVDDAYAALCWVAANAQRFNGDPSRLAVAGESAGANLAAACTLIARDQKGPALCLQVLLCPVTDVAKPERPSFQKYGQGYMLTQEHISFFFRNYCQAPHDAEDPRVILLRATSLKVLPPALIITAECDPLRDEGHEYADRLLADGVPVEYSCYSGVFHGFSHMAPILSKGRASLAQAADALRKAFES